VHVQDSSGPLDGIKVILYKFVTDAWGEDASGFTDNGGDVEFSGIPFGLYKACAVDLGGEYSESCSDEINVSEIRQYSITITMEKNPQGYKIRLKVVDEDTGNAIEGAEVSIFEYDDSTPVDVNSGITDGDGIFEYYIDSDDRVYSATVSKAGYVDKTVEQLTIFDAGSSDVQVVKLKKAEMVDGDPKNYANITIIARYQDGSVASYAYVTVYFNNIIVGYYQIDNGKVILERMPLGNYRFLFVSDYGEATHTENIDVAGDYTIEIILDCYETVVEFTVMDKDDGSLLEGALVRLGSMSETTDRDGKATFTLRPCKCKIFDYGISKNGYLTYNSFAQICSDTSYYRYDINLSKGILGYPLPIDPLQGIIPLTPLPPGTYKIKAGGGMFKLKLVTLEWFIAKIIAPPKVMLGDKVEIVFLDERTEMPIPYATAKIKTPLREIITVKADKTGKAIYKPRVPGIYEVIFSKAKAEFEVYPLAALTKAFGIDKTINTVTTALETMGNQLVVIVLLALLACAIVTYKLSEILKEIKTLKGKNLDLARYSLTVLAIVPLLYVSIQSNALAVIASIAEIAGILVSYFVAKLGFMIMKYRPIRV